MLRIPAAGGEPSVILGDCLDFVLSPEGTRGTPDGASLVGVSLDRRLAVFDREGAWLRDLEPQGITFVDYYSLAASPDGSLLAFRAVEAGGEDTWNLYVMDWSGRGVRRLTDLEGFHPSTPSTGQVNGLAWTADGAHLVYSVDSGREQRGIWLTGLGGGAPKRLFTWQAGEWAAVKGPWVEKR